MRAYFGPLALVALLSACGSEPSEITPSKPAVDSNDGELGLAARANEQPIRARRQLRVEEGAATEMVEITELHQRRRNQVALREAALRIGTHDQEQQERGELRAKFEALRRRELSIQAQTVELPLAQKSDKISSGVVMVGKINRYPHYFLRIDSIAIPIDGARALDIVKAKGGRWVELEADSLYLKSIAR